MKTLNIWLALVPVLILSLFSCEKPVNPENPNNNNNVDPNTPSLVISDIVAEANTVSFTITPNKVEFYTYSIKSSVMASDPTVCEPAVKKTFLYESLLPDSEYVLVAKGYDKSGKEIANAEAGFKTRPTSDIKLDIPHGEPSFIDYDGKKVEAKSVLYFVEQDKLWLFVSPREGIDNHIDLIYGNGGKNDYISLSFAPSQLNYTIDMKSASERYLLFNSIFSELYPKPSVDMVTIDYHQNIKSGAFKVTRDGNKVEGYIELVEANTNKKLRIYASCVYDQEAADRDTYIKKDGKSESIRSGFYRLPDDTHSELFISPASVLMGDLISEVDSYYVRIKFDHAAATEKKFVDLSQVTADFEIQYVDKTSGKDILITNKDLKGATGKIMLYRYALQGNYRVEYDITVDGVHLQAYADHGFNYFPYFPYNYYKQGTEDEVKLKSILVDNKDKNYYTIWLLPVDGITTVEAAAKVNGAIGIKVAPQALDATPRYFHDEKVAGREMSITYKGKVYTNEDTSFKGYVIGAVKGKKIALEFGEDTMKLRGYFTGDFVTVK